MASWLDKVRSKLPAGKSITPGITGGGGSGASGGDWKDTDESAKKKKKAIQFGVLAVILLGVVWFQFLRPKGDEAGSKTTTTAVANTTSKTTSTAAKTTPVKPKPKPPAASADNPNTPVNDTITKKPAANPVAANIAPPKAAKPPAAVATAAAPAQPPAKTPIADCAPGKYSNASGDCVYSPCPEGFTRSGNKCIAPGEPVSTKPDKCTKLEYRTNDGICHTKPVLGKQITISSEWDPTAMAACTDQVCRTASPAKFKVTLSNKGAVNMKNTQLAFNGGCLMASGATVDLTTPFVLKAHTKVEGEYSFVNTAAVTGVYSLQVGFSADMSNQYSLAFKTLVGNNSAQTLSGCDVTTLLPDLAASKQTWLPVK